MLLMIKLFASGTGSPEHVYGEFCTLCNDQLYDYLEDVSGKKNNVIQKKLCLKHAHFWFMVICTLCVMISNIFILRMWAGQKSMLFLVMPLACTCLVLVLVVLLVF